MITVLFAIDNEAEQRLFAEVVGASSDTMSMIIPSSLAEADQAVEKGIVDVIVTDLRFHNGGFAEWLFLWQHPFVLLADWDEYERIGSIVCDQTSDFAIRDNDLRHIRYLPLVIRKLLNSKEAIDRHNVDLRMNEERYRELVQALPDIIYSLDENGQFVFINDSVKRLGWDPFELIGKHFGTIVDPDDLPRVSRDHVLRHYQGRTTGAEKAPKLFDERRTGSRRTQELVVRLRHKDGPAGATETYGSVIAYGEVNAVGFSAGGRAYTDPGTVGIIRDVSQRREAEEIVHRSLREKETLLAEIHHRVKNNLQVISSLLNLQSGSLDDPEAQARFADAQMQIQSMALVHEHLYQSDHFGSVDLRPYVENLCGHLYDVYNVSPEQIRLILEVDSISVGMQQAMPIALMLNELISNSLKYAFPDGSSGSITVRIRLVEIGRVEIDVHDDGIGLPADFDITASKTLGQTLIASLAGQINGTIDVNGEGGTRFVLEFELLRPV
jgi:PAS domain S-box-containing protein